MANLAQNANLKLGNKVIINTIIANILLSIIKLAAGIIANSQALISDAIHTVSDVLSSVFVLFGLRISYKAEDKNHPYGHERIESIFTIGVALLLAAVAVGLGLDTFSKLQNPGQIAVPGGLALVGAIVSLIVKELMYHYTMAAARKINSAALAADAHHHRSDSLSTVGSLIGIGGAMLGFPLLDPIAAIIICLIILKTAFDLAKTAIEQLTDTAADNEVEQQIIDIIEQDTRTMALDLLKTRRHGAKIYVDIEIAVAADLSLIEAHQIAEDLHDKLENANPQIKHCLIHVNPHQG